MDKLIISAGYMCDMTYLKIGTIDADDDKNAFIHRIGGVWIFNKRKFISWMQPLANAGMSLHRIALYCVGSDAPRNELFMPWQFVSASNAWNLLKKNQSFFDILRQMAIESNRMKVQLMVCIMNECEERKPARIAQSPFYYNVNGVIGLYHNKALPYIGKLTDWILEALTGTDFAIELINEGHRRDSGSIKAVEIMLPKLYAADVKPWDISLGADVMDYAYTNPDMEFTQRWPDELHPPDFENYDHFMNRLVSVYDKKYPNATHEAFYVSHKFAEGAPDEYGTERPYGARTDYTKVIWVDHNLTSNRICFSTDGVDFADAKTGRPSPARMKAAMLYIMRSNPQYAKMPLMNSRPKLWFDFLPNGETTAEITAVVNAMAEAYHEFFGTWPENRGKVPPYVEPIPPDPIIPDPVIPQTFLKYLKQGNYDLAVSAFLLDMDWNMKDILSSSGYFNYAGLADTKMDALLEAGLREMDEKKRRQIYLSAHERWLESLPFIPLFNLDYFMGISRSIKIPADRFRMVGSCGDFFYNLQGW